MNTIHRLCTALAAVGLGASAAHAWPSIVASAAVAAAERDVDPQGLAMRCVNGFSKDICEGTMSYGGPYFGRCETAEVCSSVYMPGSRWSFWLRSNPNGCDPAAPFRAPCDESRHLDGQIDAKIDTMLRLNDTCRYRGSFDGEWSLTTVDGALYSGYLMGTLGVGTHRKSVCDVANPRDCETCVDVEYLWEQGLARIGVEAQFRGTALDSDVVRPEEVNFSLSGDLYVFIHDDGSINWDVDALWKFDGTADGVHIVCE